MMALLQWPSCSMSPSRNQTPGAICLTVLGWASPRVSMKPSESVARKLVISQRRVCFILFLRFYQRKPHVLRMRRRLPVPIEGIERRICLIRGEKVMLDADLAVLYQVETKTLNRAVRR